MVVTGEQLRAARAMVRIEQADLARQANVSVETIKRLERTGGSVSANVQTVDAVMRALEVAGIEFTNGNQPGVRLKATRVAIPEKAFVDGLERFVPILRTDAQFDGLRLHHETPTSVKLTLQNEIIGTASQYNELAYFDPGVAHEGVRETNVEAIFADWAGAALRRAKFRMT